MASIKQGILGGFKGRVGSVVGSSWKGIAVMKAKPLSVANPKTPAQIGNRTRQSKVLELGQKIGLSIIRVLWNRSAIKMSGFNMFMSANKTLFDAVGNWNSNSLVLSKGKIEATTASFVAVHEAASTITINYPTTSTGYQSGSDVAYAVVYNKNTGKYIGSDGDMLRLTGQISVDVEDSIVPGDLLEVALAFRAENGLNTSETTYATTIVLA